MAISMRQGHASTNRRCYGDEIADPRIEYGVAMTKWERVSRCAYCHNGY